MPHWRSEIRRRLAEAQLDPAREAEIVLELEAHLEDRYRELRAAGFGHDAAVRGALDEIEDDRRMRADLAAVEAGERASAPLGDPVRRSALTDFVQDVRYALRMLRRSPGFATLAILTLAVGVGATTVVYAIVDNMLLRPVPYAHIDRLVRVFETDPDRPERLVSASYPNLRDWQARSRSFDAMGVYRSRSLILTDGEPERVTAGMATPGFFAAAGASPELGRGFGEADSAPGAPRVVMISHGAWLRRFGGDRSVIGRPLPTVDGSYEIVGVLAPTPMFAGNLDFWIPFEITPAHALRDVRGLWILGRLRSDVTLEQARAEMNAIAAALETEHPENRGWGVTLMPMQDWTVLGVRQPLYMFLGAVGCILLLACANVAGLLIARGAGRSAEIAIRTALGARRWRIVRQLVTESVVLALVGGSLGALLAWLSIHSLLPLFPMSLPAARIGVDLRVLAIAIAASGFTGVLFGLAPALVLSRSGTAVALKDQARSTSRWGRRVGSGLIVIEVALSLVLLAGAGLMVRTLARLYAVDPGIDVDRLVALRATPLLPKDAAAHRTQEFYRQVIERVAAMPGVHSVAAIDTPPFGGSILFGMATSDATARAVGVSPRAVTPGYFDTMGIARRAGRDFGSADAATRGKVVILNESAAAALWPGRSPIGRHLRMQLRETQSAPYEIVGVVANVRHDGLDAEVWPEVYHPASQRPMGDMTVVARAADPDAVGRQFRSAVEDVSERALVRPPQTFAAMIGATVEQRRNRALLLTIVAALGVVLAAVGVFGVTAYSVSQRTKEIGIRIALGADARRVLRTVAGALVPPIGAGVLLGIAGARWGTGILEAFVWGVRPTDPLTFVTVTAVMTAVALLACYLPARRALRVDPVEALRAE